MKATDAVNRTMLDMIGKLRKESPLPATYLYKNDSQQRVLITLIDNGFVNEQKIPHTILRLISLTDKGNRLGELLEQITELFPPVETTNNTATESESDEDEDTEDSDESAHETVQSSLEDVVNDG